MEEKNVLVEWEDRYSVGIPFIDDQHKELIKMTNTLYEGCLQGDEAAKAYFKETIRGAVDYVKYHFAAEEQILEKIKYPGLPKHKEQHETFVKQVLRDVQSFESGKSFVPNVFVRYLKDWVLTHIAVSDKMYSEYIQNMKKKAGNKAQA
ncbi:MAG: bacteriohemerythrin [Treponema sp.]|jgi:hemerythrin|nr:bacteriohemerythrin [Treponema sp.]